MASQSRTSDSGRGKDGRRSNTQQQHTVEGRRSSSSHRKRAVKANYLELGEEQEEDDRPGVLLHKSVIHNNVEFLQVGRR